MRLGMPMPGLWDLGGSPTALRKCADAYYRSACHVGCLWMSTLISLLARCARKLQKSPMESTMMELVHSLPVDRSEYLDLVEEALNARARLLWNAEGVSKAKMKVTA